MSDSGETRTQRVRRNVIAGAITGALALSAVVGVPVAVNASNTAHAQEVAQLHAAKAESVIVRADAARDTVLAGSAVQAGVIAQQEAATKAAAAAQAAAQAAAAATAQKAAQEAAAQQAAQTQTVQATTATPQMTQAAAAASTGLPAGATPPDIPGTSSPDTTKCASGTASTVNGVPTCN